MRSQMNEDFLDLLCLVELPPGRQVEDGEQGRKCEQAHLDLLVCFAHKLRYQKNATYA
jgi:hypothetical protein